MDELMRDEDRSKTDRQHFALSGIFPARQIGA